MPDKLVFIVTYTYKSPSVCKHGKYYGLSYVSHIILIRGIKSSSF